MTNISIFEDAVKESIRRLKNNPNLEIQGRNKKIEEYYSIWSGNPKWLQFKVHLPDGTQKEEKYKTLNVARYLCRTWANNYANENTVITVPNAESNLRLQEIFQSNNFFGKFNNFVESFMGLGIGATVVGAKTYLADETGQGSATDTDVIIQFVGGRRVIPITVSDGEYIECAFISFFTGGVKLVIHYLDDQEIYNVAEVCGKGKNGNYTFDYDNIRVLNTNSKNPLFQIWHPNITDDDDVDNQYGTAIIDKAFDTFFQCDVCYTVFFKEMKLGQKVKFISAEMEIIDENGHKILPYDVNDESVISIPANTDANPMMQEFNGDLRVQSIVQALNFHLNAAAMLCGLGQSQFEFDGIGGRPIQTATGVIAKQTELYRNVVKQENFATNQFKKLVQAISYVNDKFTSSKKIGEIKINNIQVSYDDNIVEDTDSRKKQELSEVQSGTMSIAEYRSHWYAEDYESALKFVHENALLIDKYIIPLQVHMITPEMFVDLVFGKNYKNKQNLIAYIKKNYPYPETETGTGFEDETEEIEGEDNE